MHSVVRRRARTSDRAPGMYVFHLGTRTSRSASCLRVQHEPNDILRHRKLQGWAPKRHEVCIACVRSDRCGAISPEYAGPGWVHRDSEAEAHHLHGVPFLAASRALTVMRCEIVACETIATGRCVHGVEEFEKSPAPSLRWGIRKVFPKSKRQMM